MLPGCFPLRQTVYGWFAAFRDAGVRETLNHHFDVLDRERAGFDASPTAAIIDSQSIRTTESEPRRVCRRPQPLRGWGYGKEDAEPVFA